MVVYFMLLLWHPLSWEDAPAGGHARHHVVVNVAVKEPMARGTGNHVDRSHAGRQHFNHIGPAAVIKYRLAMPVDGMIVCFITQCDDVPANALAKPGFIAVQIAENATIDRMLHTAFFSFLFIENHEQGGEFLVHVARRGVGGGTCHALTSNDNGADQAEIRFFLFHYMRMVEPDD